jgi:hypothetical protein
MRCCGTDKNALFIRFRHLLRVTINLFWHSFGSFYELKEIFRLWLYMYMTSNLVDVHTALWHIVGCGGTVRNAHFIELQKIYPVIALNWFSKGAYHIMISKYMCYLYGIQIRQNIIVYPHVFTVIYNGWLHDRKQYHFHPLAVIRIADKYFISIKHTIMLDY